MLSRAGSAGAWSSPLGASPTNSTTSYSTPGREKNAHARARTTPGLHGLAAGPGRTFHVATDPVAPSDPRSAAFDVEARYGRRRAEAEQRKRKHAAQERAGGELPRGAPLDARPGEPAEPADALRVDSDARALSALDPHSTASHALLIAQDTLDAKRRKPVPPKPTAKRDGASARVRRC